MPEFQTIPAEEGALLQKPKASLRRVIVAAAALSFVLGAVAATAVGTTSTAAMDLHGSTTKISDAHISNIASGQCLTVNSRDDLELGKCGTGNGKGHHSKQRFNYEYKTGSGRINYRDGKRYDVVSVDAECWDPEENDCEVTLSRKDNSINFEQNLHWDPVKKYIKSHNDDGKELCITKMSSTKVLWKPCGRGYSIASQKWQIGGDAPEPPSPAFNCPWKNDKPCMSDSDCVWVGGKNTCSKCHKNPGRRSICGPK